MDIDMLQSFLGWCSVINICILLYWACFLVFAPDWTYRYSTRWINITQEQFNNIHFALIGGFKLVLLFFNVIPYFVLQIIA